MRLIKKLLILIFCCFTISCSLIKTTYNNVPSLVIWGLDDYFSFTTAQNLVLKPSLQKLHDWHRQYQLPQYVSLLQNMQNMVTNEEISPDDVCRKVDDIKLSIHTLQVESIPIIIETAPLLSAKQMSRFQRKLGERSEKWKSDWWQETKQAQIDVRLEKTKDFAEKVYGDLNDEQINLLEESIMQSAFNPALAYKEILRRNEEAYNILSQLQKQTLSDQEKMALLKIGFEQLQKSPNQYYQNHADLLANQTCKTIANLHTSTNAKQKLHAKNWLEEYIKQLNALQIK